MKRTILNLGAILMAFLIGLAINNACADNLDNLSDSELKKLVSQMQQEISALKQRVAQLESQVKQGGVSGSGSSGGFDVDGIHFDASGYPEHKIDRIEYSGYSITNGARTELTGYTHQYEYDAKGRLLKAGDQKFTYFDKRYHIDIDASGENYQTHMQYDYYLK